jgi:hypothetical protein
MIFGTIKDMMIHEFNGSGLMWKYFQNSQHGIMNTVEMRANQ